MKNFRLLTLLLLILLLLILLPLQMAMGQSQITLTSDQQLNDLLDPDKVLGQKGKKVKHKITPEGLHLELSPKISGQWLSLISTNP